MSRNNSRPSRRFRAFAAALAVAGALPLMGSALIDPSTVQTKEAEYTTAQAQYGSIVEEMATSAYMYRPTHVDVRCKVRDARVAEIAVFRSDLIEKGTKLGVLRSESSRADMTQTSLSLARAKEQYDEQVAAKQEAIVLKQDSLQSAGSAAQREILRLEIQKMELELSDYCLRQEKTIADLEEKLAEQAEALEDVEIYAPVTGKVSYFSYVAKGDSVGYNSVLLTLQTDDPTLIRLEDPNGLWRYGMPVRVEYGPRNNRTVVTGQIISADNVLSATERTGYAFAKLDQPLETEISSTITAYGEEFRLDNVLVIPKDAYVLSLGKSQVSILEDSSIANRYVSIGMTNKDTAWVMQGLNEGQSVIVD